MAYIFVIYNSYCVGQIADLGTRDTCGPYKLEWGSTKKNVSNITMVHNYTCMIISNIYPLSTNFSSMNSMRLLSSLFYT